MTQKYRSRAIVEVNGKLYWKEWHLLAGDELVAFYDGDRSKVLEPDPEIEQRVNISMNNPSKTSQASQHITWKAEDPTGVQLFASMEFAHDSSEPFMVSLLFFEGNQLIENRCVYILRESDDSWKVLNSDPVLIGPFWESLFPSDYFWLLTDQYLDSGRYCNWPGTSIEDEIYDELYGHLG